MALYAKGEQVVRSYTEQIGIKKVTPKEMGILTVTPMGD
jgi:hypothetical protein